MGFLEDRVKSLGEGVSNLGSGWDLKSTLFIILLIIYGNTQEQIVLTTYSLQKIRN